MDNIIDINSWKLFKMCDVFSFSKGKRLIKQDMIPGNLNYLGAISDNNAIRDHIDANPLHLGNCITVNYNGSVGEAFYQSEPFWATDDINILDLKSCKMTKNIGLFLCTIIKKNRYKFSYGRKWTLDKMKESNIFLPIKNEEIDFEFMDNYINSLNIKPIKTKINKTYIDLNIKNWKKFMLRDIFNFKRGKGITKEEIEENIGTIPCIQGGESNNGVLGYMNDSFKNSSDHVFVSSPFLGLARVGTSGYVSIQNKDSYIGDKAIALKLKYEKNLYIYVFLSTVLNMEKNKYMYGRGVVIENYIDEHILLPADDNGEPNWEFMENYIKSLPYSDNLE
jgi:hypothetical protein